MRNDNRLSAAQKKFLRAMRNDVTTLPEMIESLGVKPFRLARWCRHPVFKGTLADVMREVRRLGDTELELTVRGAKRALALFIAGKLTLDRLQLAACLGLLEAHARLRELQRKRPGGRARAKRNAPDAVRPKHPGHTDEEGKRMLDELYDLQTSKNRPPSPRAGEGGGEGAARA